MVWRQRPNKVCTLTSSVRLPSRPPSHGNVVAPQCACVARTHHHFSHSAEVGISVDKCFVAYGGFLLLNAAGEVVAAQAVMSTVRGEAIPKIHFLRQETCPPSIVSELRGDGRLRNVTLPALLSCGVESFCWVNPHEPPQGGQDDQMTAHRVTRKKNKELTKHGAFLYTFANGSEAIWFHVMDPKKVLQAHKEAQATIQEYRRSHMIRGAVVHRRGMQLYEQAVATEERKSYFRTAVRAHSTPFPPFHMLHQVCLIEVNHHR